MCFVDGGGSGNGRIENIVSLYFYLTRRESILGWSLGVGIWVDGVWAFDVCEDVQKIPGAEEVGFLQKAVP